jgi:cytochrome c-type biogenesis protein CcmF
VTVIGIAASAWSVEAIGTVSVGERIAVGPYEARLDRVVPRTGPNYREDAATVTVMRNGREAGTVETMKRIYLTRGMPTTEAGILTSGSARSMPASAMRSPTDRSACGSTTSPSCC